MTAARILASSPIARILVVDAKRTIRQLLERHPAHDFAMQSATTAPEAKALAIAHQPEAILVAAVIPGVDSFALITELRAMPELTGVAIALVGGPGRSAGLIDRALDAGADDLIEADLDAPELSARVRVMLRVRQQLRSMRAQLEDLARSNERLEQMALRDPLTGLYNRRCFEQRLVDEVERARRYGQSLSLVAVDIDFFKMVNDKYGHAIGDSVLRTVAVVMQRALRKVDLIARIGGEEFVVLAPATDEVGIAVLCPRLRAAIAEFPIMASTASGMHATLRLTASFGVATLHGRDGAHGMSASGLIEAADAALYRAKANGRDRVEYHTE